MTEIIFGLDFGTTNSLAALIVGGEVQTLGDDNAKPHPSVVWYRGDEVVVGRQARSHLESLDSGVRQGFVRSPKMALRREGLVHIEGRALDATDIVAEVLLHIRREAAARSDRAYSLSRAVMTVPVDFAGPQRRALRSAARKAGIGVVQFVHEPAAALYGYLRSRPDFRRFLAQLENRVVLVFDWGGGTLDLTVCRVLGGEILQIKNRGNNDIGGDRFDERIRNEIRDRHANKHGVTDISALEQPGAAAALLTQCEQAKIALSEEESFPVLVKDYLRSEGSERNLLVQLTRSDIERLSRDLVNAGLAEIDRLLDEAGLERSDIELCLATGGMVNMPAIWDGLVERFGARVPRIHNRDSIIAEGAAWIAHDDLRLTLAKPLEVLIADGSGRGTYFSLVSAGFELPVENKVASAVSRRFFCVDPRDGVAVFEFAKPRKVGLLQASDERTTLCSVNLLVDPGARAFAERLECEVQIDHDYVARLSLTSLVRGDKVSTELHDLDFGLSILGSGGPDESTEVERSDQSSSIEGAKSATQSALKSEARSNVIIRSNISENLNWKLVPGDIVEVWKPGFMQKDSPNPSQFQRDENMYYARCKPCGRTIYQIRLEGPVETCRKYPCGKSQTSTYTHP